VRVTAEIDNETNDQGDELMAIQNEIKCFVAGITVGATAAVLFSPKSGPQSRKYLREKAAARIKSFKDQGEEFTATAVSVVERGAKRVRHEQENIGAAMDAAQQAYREAEEITPGIGG
jgi:gas vesicle protein